MIQKNYWIKDILRCVKQIADPEYQERAWIKCEIHWPCSLEELACSFLGDSYLDNLINEAGGEFKLANQQKESLKILANSLDKYCDNPEIYFPRRPPKINEAKVIADPEWHKIRKQAQKVLEAFGKIEFTVTDKEWWLQFILQAIQHYADIEEQKRMWEKKTEVFYSTPRDMHKQLFDSNDFERFIDEYAEKFGLTKQQIGALNKFRLHLKKTPFDITHFENLLSNPEWQKIQSLAKEVIDIFHFSMN